MNHETFFLFHPKKKKRFKNSKSIFLQTFSRVCLYFFKKFYQSLKVTRFQVRFFCSYRWNKTVRKKWKLARKLSYTSLTLDEFLLTNFVLYRRKHSLSCSFANTKNEASLNF